MVDIILGMIGAALVFALLAKTMETTSENYKILFVVFSILSIIIAGQTMNVYAINESINGTSSLAQTFTVMSDFALLIFVTLIVLALLIHIITDLLGRLRAPKHPKPQKPGASYG